MEMIQRSTTSATIPGDDIENGNCHDGGSVPGTSGNNKVIYSKRVDNF